MNALLADPAFSLAEAESTALQAALDEFRGTRHLHRAHVVVLSKGSYGDALQVTPLLHSLRGRFPTARITFVNPSCSAAELVKENPDIDETLSLGSEAQELLRELLLSECLADLIVDCRYVIEYIAAQPASRLSSEDLDFIHCARSEQNHWLHLVRRFPVDNDELWRAAAARGWSMYQLMAWTSGFVGADFDRLRMHLQAGDFTVRSRLPERYIVVTNSASERLITHGAWTKTLPHEKMARIVARLSAFGIPIVLLGQEVDASVPGVDIDLRGKTAIREAAAILKDASVLVAPEGGLANLAHAVGTRSVVFFGSTPPEFFALKANVTVRPKRCGGCWWTTRNYLNNCPRLLSVPECVNSIAEDEVVAGVEAIIRPRRTAPLDTPARSDSDWGGRVLAQIEGAAE
jgi:ADP-heptose:LPS heptosyltransferase